MKNTTIKIWNSTRTELRLLSAEFGKPMTKLIDNAVVLLREQENYEKEKKIESEEEKDFL